MIEVEDLFAEDEVLEHGGAARAGLQAVLVVADGGAVVGRQNGRVTLGALMGFAAVAGVA